MVVGRVGVAWSSYYDHAGSVVARGPSHEGWKIVDPLLAIGGCESWDVTWLPRGASMHFRPMSARLCALNHTRT